MGDIYQTHDALALAMAGRSRAESARVADVSTTEMSRPRRETMTILADCICELLAE